MPKDCPECYKTPGQAAKAARERGEDPGKAARAHRLRQAAEAMRLKRDMASDDSTFKARAKDIAEQAGGGGMEMRRYYTADSAAKASLTRANARADSLKKLMQRMQKP